MAESSPNPLLQPMDSEPVLQNGTSAPTDIEMSDSQAPQEVITPRSPPNYSSSPLHEPPEQLSISVIHTLFESVPSNAAPQQPAAQVAPAPTPQPPPASSRNSPHPTAQAPTQPIPHGSPTRVYLNTYVTPHLLEAMKHLATTEPEKPLKWLSEFLAQKSAELEGP